MMRHLHLVVLLAVCAAGCGKQEPVSAPDWPEFTAARARAAHDGLTPSMSDEQILRAIGHDPSALRVHRDDGVDGHSMTYTNDKTYIIVSRSLVSGISVLRLHPKDQKQLWMMDKK
jgi:hypothetical protein